MRYFNFTCSEPFEPFKIKTRNGYQTRYHVSYMQDGLTREDITCGHILEALLHLRAGEPAEVSKADWRSEPDSKRLNASIKTMLGELPEDCDNLSREDAVHLFCTESAGKWFMFGWHPEHDPHTWEMAVMTWTEAEYFLLHTVQRFGNKWRIGNMTRKNFKKWAWNATGR